jgi:hypothetical protein
MSKSKGPKRPPERPPRPSQPNHDLRAFFKPRVPLNPPTVVAPPLIHPDEFSLSNNLESLAETRQDSLEESLEESNDREALEIGEQVGAPLGAPLPAGKIPCRKGIELLDKLEAAVTRIPNTVPLATPAHRLSAFSADPRSWVNCLEQGSEVDLEDDWIMLNSMLKTAFGWGESEMQEGVKEMINRGEHGLDGFIQFFKYFVLQRGLEGTLIEPKIDGLLHEIDNQ